MLLQHYYFLDTRFYLLRMSVSTYHACLFISLFTREKTFHQFYNTFFTLISDTHIHQTRHSVINLVLPFSRTSGFKTDLSFRGPQLWSKLSLSLRSMSSLSVFKKTVERIFDFIITASGYSLVHMLLFAFDFLLS